MNEKVIFGEKKTKAIEVDGMKITYYDFIDYINLIDRILDNKKKLSERSNAYNKAHPERHRQLTRESAKRRADRIKQYQKEYFQKNKKRIAEYRKEAYHRKKEVK